MDKVGILHGPGSFNREAGICRCDHCRPASMESVSRVAEGEQRKISKKDRQLAALNAEEVASYLKKLRIEAAARPIQKKLYIDLNVSLAAVLTMLGALLAPGDAGALLFLISIWMMLQALSWER